MLSLKQKQVLKHLLNRLRSQPSLLFLFQFILLYFIGRILFWGYIGLLYPSGKQYWPFLSNFNIIQGIRTALIYPTNWIMQFMGTKTIPYSMGILYKERCGGIRIEFSCLGIQVMIAYVALILAFSAPKKYLYLTGGILFIHVLNIARMVGLMQMQVHHSLNPKNLLLVHDLFNYGAYIGILLLFYLYTRGAKKHPSHYKIS